jgi:lysine biosynthesis protein LysW
MPYTRCPHCEKRIYFPEMPDIGDIVECQFCKARLEVVGLRPIELDWLWEEEEEEEEEELEGFEIWEEDDLDEDLDEDDEDFALPL